MNEIIPRVTIEQMVGARNQAIELFRVAYGKLTEAQEAVLAARKACHPFQPEHGHDHSHDEAGEVKNFWAPLNGMLDEETFRYVSERIIDIDFWHWIIEKGDLYRLMDKQAKDQLRDQLRYVPIRSRNGRDVIDEKEAARSFPPVTVENVVATIQEFAAQSDFIFKRGVANAFSKLDRRFRSHDGFKVGSRVILDYLIDTYNWPSQNKLETLADIERAFLVVDERNLGRLGEAAWRIDQARHEARRGYDDKNKRGQFEVVTEYFKIRCFRNGNAHLWMQRDDLVEKINKILAEYYGEVVGDARTRDDPLRKTGGPLAMRDFDLFPTPEAVANLVIEAAGLWRDKDAPPLRVLEPSAGLGNLALRAIAEGCAVDCVEIHTERAHLLRGLDGVGAVYIADFLRLSPETTGLYDRVIMNPPFTGERDIDHVNHALRFLKPGGTLVAVMSAGTEFRETQKAIAFRAKIEALRGRARGSWRNGWNKHWRDLPEGSFREVGTNINTLLLTVSVEG